MEGELQRIAGVNIRAYRKAKGISQEELADALGVHRTYMGGVERGERNLTLLAEPAGGGDVLKQHALGVTDIAGSLRRIQWLVGHLDHATTGQANRPDSGARSSTLAVGPDD